MNYLSSPLYAKSDVFGIHSDLSLKSSTRYCNSRRKAFKFLILKQTRCKINSYAHWILIGRKQTPRKYLYNVKRSVLMELDLLIYLQSPCYI